MEADLIPNTIVEVGDVRFGNALPLTLIAGPCALESRDHAFEMASALKEIAACDKLNVAAIGNIVPQLHIHIVARRKDDPLWPKPVWGAAPRRAGESAAMERFAGAIRDRLRLPPSL